MKRQIPGGPVWSWLVLFAVLAALGGCAVTLHQTKGDGTESHQQQAPNEGCNSNVWNDPMGGPNC